MLKIQYGIAGFFTGVFIALLLAIIESKVIDNRIHPERLFLTIASTLIVCGIAGMVRGLKMAGRNKA